MRGENGSTIRNNCIGESVKSNDMRNKELGEVGDIDGLGARNEVTHFGHSIDEHED